MGIHADIGVFGGSGFYSFLENVESHEIITPYGKPSDSVSIAELSGRRVAFIPRHGRNHNLPPHMIPYTANLYAMKMLGVKRIIAPTASGSLQPHIRPGDFVVCDQFIDRTWGRKDTFHDGPETIHTSAAKPYCSELRALSAECGRELGITMHEKGTVVVIQGPRFSTTSESRWFSRMGWEVINMTQYPECYLALELGICYANISLVTDYDAGLDGQENVQPVTHEEVIRVFEGNNEKLKKLLFRIIERIDTKAACSSCKHS